MAVLKDLIVHGPSRFINGAKFNTINAESIGASEGIFNKLVATTLDAREATIDNLTADNAKILGILDVQGDLHTKSWTNSNISNIGGSFYIAPTVSTIIAETNTPMSIAIGGSAGARTFQVTGGAFVTDAVKTYNGTTTSTVTWSVGSHVMVTGNIRLTATGVDYPLGTLNGYLTSPVTTGGPSALVANGFTIGEVDSPALETIISELGTTNLKSYEIKISMYEIGPKTSIKPVGIMMTSYGIDKSTYIDIYGGVNVKSSNGATVPNVRIGYLGGLGTLAKVNNESPTGWGIYTDNGYFNGVIVSQSGKIGGFSIGSADLSNGSLGTTGSVWVSTGTDGAASIGGSESITNWAFTAGNSFGVTTDGTVYASGARISGNVEITSSDTIYTKDEVNAELSLKITNPEEDDGADFMTALSAVIDRLNIIADNIFLGSDSNISVADELNKFNSSISIDTSHSTVQIGQASDFNVLITPTRLSFMNGQTEVAYISQNQLFIKQSVVLDQMDLGRVEGSEDPVTGEIGKGQWAWTVHENSSGKNNLHLKWMG